jgi:hypothetical protein
MGLPSETSGKSTRLPLFKAERVRLYCALSGEQPPHGETIPTVQDDNPPALAMSEYDFYRAACVEAHARLLL